GQLDVDFGAYRIKKLRLSDFSNEPSQSFSSMLCSLRRYINNGPRQSDSFLVVLDCVGDTSDQIGPSKQTTFLETKVTFLDKYFKRKVSEPPLKRHRIALQS
uniref:Uncharacterized protein n=1 Tax=Parascaris univalens TaxID=6257 RepID=A0A915A4X2_PARUN